MAGAGAVQTYLDAAIVHIAAGEYDNARTDLLAAEVALVGVPDTDIARWRATLTDVWAHLKELTKESSSFRPRRMLYDRP